MKYNNEAQLLREQLAKMEIQSLERDYKILEIDYKIQRASSGWGMVDFREYMQLREHKRREMQEKLREMQDKRREIIEETIRRDFEEKERNDTQHRSPNIGGEGRQGSYESETMAYKNPTKPSGHPFDDKHLLDAHPSCLFGARMKEAASDTLVHRYTPVGVTREPVREQDTTAWEVRSSPPGLRLPTKPNSHDANTKDGKYNSGHSGLLRDGTRTSDTLVHRYTPIGVKREPVGRLHRHSSTEDNSMTRGLMSSVPI